MGDKHGARYVSNKKQRSIAFSQSSRKKSRGILNAQLLFQSQNKIFRQIIMIPMELDATPSFCRPFFLLL